MSREATACAIVQERHYGQGQTSQDLGEVLHSTGSLQTFCRKSMRICRHYRKRHYTLEMAGLTNVGSKRTALYDLIQKPAHACQTPTCKVPITALKDDRFVAVEESLTFHSIALKSGAVNVLVDIVLW